uniref:Ribosomal RNA methyltransferase n=1 Tax=Solanum tuberosum TaxID=4113 RepID=M1A2T4_SOLTU
MVFVEPEEQEMLDKYNNEDEMLIDRVGERAPISKTQTTSELLVPIMTKKRMDGLLQVPSPETPNDFEIVPVPPTDSSDSSFDESSDDIDRKAEILSIAKKSILKMQREAMMDDGYNKYKFDDEGLPKWFVDEEKRHDKIFYTSIYRKLYGIPKDIMNITINMK